MEAHLQRAAFPGHITVSDLLTHIVEPCDDLGLGRGVGPDVAVEVDVVALPDVGGHEATPQLDRHNRRICEDEDAYYANRQFVKA